MSFLGKLYTSEKIENLMEFISALDPIPEEIKEKIAKTKLSSKVEKDGDTYILTVTTDNKTKEIKFKNGVEYDTEFMPGIDVKAICVVEGNCMTQTCKKDDGKEMTIKREYTDDQLIETFSSNFSDTTGRIIYRANLN